MSDTVIAASNVSKRYLIGEAEQRHETLAGSMVSALLTPIRNARKLARLDVTRVSGDASDILWALDDVSFEVKRGEVLGIIGRNGAGKSTLLKILSRITEPTSGWVGIKGRIAALLEVGTGFHPELTGRDNVYLNGTLLGMTKREVDRRFAAIVEFSGVERFLDTPIKRYSSGMQVRLAFAVAAHLDPEILIIDEVLAVGDYEFQRKCLGKMEEVARGGQGRTILFVSHNMGLVRSLCTRCLYLKSGQLVDEGDTDSIIELYERHQVSDGTNGLFRQPPDDRFALQVLEAELCDAHGQRQTIAVDQFSPLTLRIRYIVREPLVGCNICMSLTYRGARLLITFDTDLETELHEKRNPGQYEATVALPAEILKAGSYRIGLDSGITNDESSRAHHQKFENILTFEVQETGDASLKAYAHQRGGIVAYRSNWNTRPLEKTKLGAHETSVTSGTTT